MKVSVIIPTYNEQKRIGKLIDHLFYAGNDLLKEIIVADGGSTDRTLEIVKSSSAKLLQVTAKGRANQMNAAVDMAEGNMLYFVHADSWPPKTYLEDIQNALANGHPAGSYRFKFDSNRKLLGINSYFTRFGSLICRGGDQSMYIRKSLFEEMGRFDESYVIMEDFDFIRRFNKKHKFHVIQKEILVSDRKYENNSYLRVQVANLLAYTMFKKGFCQHKIKFLYERLLDLSYE